ncbi:CinA family protein [Entomobacter blattae]|uniref:Nicotinamide-nucleotide amidohydrolase PncC n=1 Tax=Entomobacter blattae TaxID=2762277 RepID=A0A7H1NSG3_9PROT|nr:CinA family protein [Entomobacter blattae]QNT78723.1 Nicotinamide-nucleotide amidohydrolase PncC [Entomobacter blattae]
MFIKDLEDLPPPLIQRSLTTLTLLQKQNLHVVTAESCTGGLIAASLTHHAGSSNVVLGGFVSYANSFKQHQLGVPAETLKTVGAVSQETAIFMAKGALEKAQAHIAISVTGIAGPGGGSTEKPVGLVWFAVTLYNQPHILARSKIFSGTRSAIRIQAAIEGLQLVEEAISK